MVEMGNQEISISRQVKLLNISRSFLYHKETTNKIDEDLMLEIDKIYTEMPFYGARRIQKELEIKGYEVTRYKVGELMKQMGITAIYPKKKTSIANKEHKKYPYLLRDKKITKVNEVWSTDITYIKLRTGWIYLSAIIDWYSRKIIAWKLSNSMDISFCIETLKDALDIDKPEIFNSDQGSQYTSQKFTSILEQNEIQISMDGVGRCLDNIYIERFWRSLKYEDIYIKKYENMIDAYNGISEYINFYNKNRIHSSLGYNYPESVRVDGAK